MGIPGVLAKTHHLHHQSGTVHQEFAVPVAAGQTIRRGDFLTMAAGQVSQAIALPAPNNMTASGGVAIYGVAVSDSYTDLAGALVCNVAPVTKGLQVLLPIFAGANPGSGTGTDAEQQDLNRTLYYQLGRYRALGGGEAFYVITTITAGTPELRPLQPYKGDTPTTPFGRVYVQIRDTAATAVAQS